MTAPAPQQLPDAVVIVLFGATGDLAGRMVLPALVEVHRRGLMPDAWRLIGVAAEELDDDAFRDRFQAAVAASEHGLCDDWDEVRDRTRYCGGRFGPDDDAGLPTLLEEVRAELRADTGAEPLVLHFLAVPPAAFGPITRGLGAHGLADGARVVFEKPYGSSLASFEELDATVKEVLAEEQIFRIDHFLGKEGVQTIYVLRFANQLFSSEWNRASVAQVQIDVPEDLDVTNRIGFYEATGAALDMLVTHLFQVVGQVAMEPPADLRDPASVIAAREAALRAFRPLDPTEDVVLGQFEGYRDIEGAAADSTQDTFVAARLWVDTERWRGVPFLLRTGKRMARKEQRITLVLSPPFGPLGGELEEPNTIEIDFAGEGEVALGITVKTPGPELTYSSGRARLDLDDVPGGEGLSPYASLINDALIGDRSLYTTENGLRAAFTAFAPLQGPDRPTPLPYAPGSWGPEEARRLAAPHRWMLGE
ncbi:glucose-6-phosphate dehydrogenase [Georgenia yuyongxinii]|uniref:Glucose-6-phosphate 1-dehydrogenase n=1 Tax=Georgenia yuyongxinii TaxID=2589797 RepID=A0A5B8C3R6_9MICO|nr:glucose-6-phosphate dehydrogenase [Georgenia yuyongxinii]QDC25389.1 glucose-6-phosphate dehydrogenase [Georgenia yuyongxinii]